MVFALVSPLRAQTPDAVAHAAATITPEAVARHLEVLAADSLRHRVTPSPELERTAQYVAGEFQRLGLQPGMQKSWVQRYPLPGQRRVNYAASTMMVMFRLKAQGKNITNEAGDRLTKVVDLGFTTTAYFTPEIELQTIARKTFRPSQVEDFLSISQPIAIVAGRQTAASVREAAGRLHEHAVLYVPAAGVDSTVRHQIIAELYAVSSGVLILSEEDSIRFAMRVAQQPPVVTVDEYLKNAEGARRRPWAISAREEALQGLLGAAGVDLAQLQIDSMPVVSTLPSAAVFLLVADMPAVADLATAPNVVGLLEGSDSALKDQYVVVTAPMDDRLDTEQHDSSSASTAGNTAGVAELLAVAQALRQPEARPRRSVLLLATSGGHASWGGYYFVDTWPKSGKRGPALVANLTLDRMDLRAGDSLWIDGLPDVKLETSPVWVARAHPDLGVVVTGEETAVQPSSDHFPFVQVAVPSLFVHTAPEVNDARTVGPTAIDSEYAASIARLIFYVVREMTTADQSPQWSSEGRQRLGTVLAP